MILCGACLGFERLSYFENRLLDIQALELFRLQKNDTRARYADSGAETLRYAICSKRKPYTLVLVAHARVAYKGQIPKDVCASSLVPS